MLRRLFKAVEPFLKSPCELHSYAYHEKAKNMGIQLNYSPADCTHLGAVTDAGPGNEVKKWIMASKKDRSLADRSSESWAKEAEKTTTEPKGKKAEEILIFFSNLKNKL